MKTRVRKLTNISDTQLRIQLDNHHSVYLKPNESIENRDVYNIKVLEGLVAVEQDLSEVVPVRERIQLNG